MTQAGLRAAWASFVKPFFHALHRATFLSGEKGSIILLGETTDNMRSSIRGGLPGFLRGLTDMKTIQQTILDGYHHRLIEGRSIVKKRRKETRDGYLRAIDSADDHKTARATRIPTRCHA